MNGVQGISGFGVGLSAHKLALQFCSEPLLVTSVGMLALTWRGVVGGGGAQITVEVRAPLESCFAIWADRLNYMQWFTMIKEVDPPPPRPFALPPPAACSPQPG